MIFSIEIIFLFAKYIEWKRWLVVEFVRDIQSSVPGSAGSCGSLDQWEAENCGRLTNRKSARSAPELAPCREEERVDKMHPDTFRLSVKSFSLIGRDTESCLTLTKILAQYSNRRRFKLKICKKNVLLDNWTIPRLKTSILTLRGVFSYFLRAMLCVV